MLMLLMIVPEKTRGKRLLTLLGSKRWSPIQKTKLATVGYSAVQIKLLFDLI